jgi:quinoprotein glucose dehydrogenase
VTALLLLLSGAGLAVPGAYLIWLGGSPYYLICGAALIATAILMIVRRSAAHWLYAATFAGSVLWSLWEVGPDGWALMPRLVFLAVAGLWLAIPALFAVARAHRARAIVALLVGVAVASLGAAIALTGAPVQAQGPAPASAGTPASPAQGEWPHYGGPLGGGRFSSLDQITPANAEGLERAWVYRTGLTIAGGERQSGLQVTPLMVDGTLYGCTGFSAVFALDPVTGRQIWRYDPVIQDDEGGHAVCRGVAFFRAPPGVAECPTRLLLGTVANKLIALDARTGKLCPSFGRNGEVDLREGIGNFPKRWSHPTSPPTIVRGVAIVGAYVVDNQSANAPPGVVRGYDAVTGRLKWAFDPARPDDPSPLPPGGVYTPSTPNSWSIASGDEALGLVYLPTGNGGGDFVGAQRSPATERFSSSVIALDAETGRVRWTFQAVHHDLWDYDIAAQPVLADVPVGGRSVPGLILATKTAQLFVLDRRNGRPLSAVEERPVPASTVPGERASPTQPFSVAMPDLAGADLTEADMWGLTPFDQLYCRIRFRQATYQGVFTPPRLGPTIRYPGELGGIDWGSVAVDPRRAILYANSNHMADLDELITRAQADREGLVPRLDAKTHSAPGGPLAGTPYAVHWGPFLSGLDVPCQRPPYGYLTAIDLKTKQILWRRTIGDARSSGPFRKPLGLPLELGAPNIGGSVVTQGGLVFIAATQDEMFRAIDARTGRTVWQTKLPAAGHATPMTYLGRDGHQYVVIAAGGRSLRTKAGDYIIGYRLNRADRP